LHKKKTKRRKIRRKKRWGKKATDGGGGGEEKTRFHKKRHGGIRRHSRDPRQKGRTQKNEGSPNRPSLRWCQSSAQRDRAQKRGPQKAVLGPLLKEKHARDLGEICKRKKGFQKQGCFIWGSADRGQKGPGYGRRLTHQGLKVGAAGKATMEIKKGKTGGCIKERVLVLDFASRAKEGEPMNRNRRSGKTPLPETLNHKKGG